MSKKPRTLDIACSTPTPSSDGRVGTDEWPALPEGVKGVQIRHRKIFGFSMASDPGVRLGAAEPKVIVAETDQWIVYAIYGADGRYLGERTHLRSGFQEFFERREPVEQRYVVSPASYKKGYELCRRTPGMDSVIATYEHRATADTMARILNGVVEQEV